MSFARFALRTSALYALKGATLVQDNVRDSDFSAIDIEADGSLRTSQDRPFILIYTDDGTAEDVDARDLRQNGLVDFVCEFGIASAMTATNDDGESVIVGVNVPVTDAAFEMTLDIVDRQIVSALTGSGAWAEIWRRLSMSAARMERRRTASVENGMRIAARQLRVRLAALPDPVWGQPLADGSVWTEFIDALDEEGPDLATVARNFIGPQEGALTYEMIRASRGLTRPEADALRVGPAYAGGDDWTITEPQVEDDGPTA